MAIVDRAFAQYGSEDAVAKSGQAALEGMKTGMSIAQAQADIDYKREILNQKKQEVEQDKDKVINDALKTAFDSNSTPALQEFSLKKYEALSKKFGRVPEDYSYKKDDSLNLLLKESSARQIAFKLIASGSSAPEIVRAVDSMSPSQINEFLKSYQKSQENLATVSALNKEKASTSGLQAVLAKGLKLADDPGLKAANPELAQKLASSELALNDPASYAQSVGEASQLVSGYRAGRDTKADELKQSALDAKARADAIRASQQSARLGIQQQRLEQGSTRIKNAEFSKIDKLVDATGEILRKADTDLDLLNSGQKVGPLKFKEVLINLTNIFQGGKGVISQRREAGITDASWSKLTQLRKKVEEISPEGLANFSVSPAEIGLVRDTLSQVRGIRSKFLQQDVLEKSKNLVQRKVINSQEALDFARSKMAQFGIKQQAEINPADAAAKYNKLLGSKDKFIDYMTSQKNLSKEAAEVAYDQALRDAKKKAGIE